MTKVLLIANSSFTAKSEFENFFNYLSQNLQVSVTSVAHPLLRTQTQLKTEHRHSWKGQTTTVERPRLFRPPLSFLIDPLHQRFEEYFDVVIGFNPLQTVLSRRLIQKNGVLVNWAIDFVPSEHYPLLLRNVYTAIDRKMVKSVDLLIENNEFAASARTTRAGFKAKRSLIVPITIGDHWIDNVDRSRRNNKNIIYVGTMNTRNGVDFLMEVAIRVLAQDNDATFTFIGDGPLHSVVHARITELGLKHRIEILGYIDDEQVILDRLRQASIAVAPYAHQPESFTRFADPQKLKWYAAAGLPMIVSPEPPSADELGTRGAAIVHSANGRNDVNVWSQAIRDLMNDEQRWTQMSNQSQRWAMEFSRQRQYERVWTSIQTIRWTTNS